MEKIYILTLTTYDAGVYLDEILGVFKTEEEAIDLKERIEANENYDLGEHRWLSVDEYIVGKFLAPHMLNQEGSC